MPIGKSIIIFLILLCSCSHSSNIKIKFIHELIHDNENLRQNLMNEEEINCKNYVKQLATEDELKIISCFKKLETTKFILSKEFIESEQTILIATDLKKTISCQFTFKVNENEILLESISIGDYYTL